MTGPSWSRTPSRRLTTLSPSKGGLCEYLNLRKNTASIRHCGRHSHLAGSLFSAILPVRLPSVSHGHTVDSSRMKVSRWRHHKSARGATLLLGSELMASGTETDCFFSNSHDLSNLNEISGLLPPACSNCRMLHVLTDDIVY